ncbi:MAG: CD0415/CD1112 family protein [Defluviitaleaceae bacterium]|nr:CD0415/CD1112 family protein [Defluviitaleaceae bacterium]
MGDFIQRIFNDIIAEIEDILIQGIVSNVENAFANWENEVEQSAQMLAQTPENFLGGYHFGIIENFANSTILPIALVAFALIVGYEFMSMLSEGNTLRDFDYTHLFKWLVKVFIGVLLLTNVFPIVNWIFGIGAEAVTLAQEGMGIEALNFDIMLDALEDNLRNYYFITTLSSLWITSFLLGFIMTACRMIIMIIVIYRMILILMKMSLAPIPFATLINREWSSVGNNYIKTLVATSFQGFLMIMVLVLNGATMALIPITPSAEGIGMMMFVYAGVSVMMIILLLKTQQISKSIFGAS